MKGFEIMKLKERDQIIIMTILLSLCAFLTFYFHAVLGIGIVFTHFFYIPIIIASIWWKRKGIIAALFLSILLVLSHMFIRGNVSTINDFFRAPMFIVVGLVTAILSERIAKGQKALQKSYDKSEQRVIERTSELKLANEQLESEVNERRHAEKALQESKGKLSAMLQSIGDHMSMMDENLNILWANDIAKKVFGEDIIGKKCYKTYHGKEKPCDDGNCIAIKTFRDGKVHEHDTQVIDKNGKTICFHCTANVSLKDEKGKPTAVLEISRDVTEHKKGEEALRESEEKFRTIFNSINDAVFIQDSETGAILDVNSTMCEMYGYTRKEVLQLKNQDLSLGQSPYSQQEALEWMRKAAAGNPQVFEWMAKHKSGRLFWVEVNIKKAIIESQDRLLIVARDITGRKKAEEELKESEAKLNEAQRIAKIGSWDLDLITNKLSWSDEVYRMFGFKPQQFGETYESFLKNIHPEDRELVNKAYTDSLKNKEPYNIIHRLKIKDGTIKYVNERCETFYDDSGKPILSIGTIQDITERKKAEEARERLNAELIQKNKELEQIVFVASHDLRSPLVNIKGFSSELELSIKELITKLQDESITNEVKEKIAPLLEEEIPEALQFILKSTAKMDTLLTGLLKLSRVGRAELTIVKIDMNKLISDIIDASAFQIKDLDVKLDVNDLPPCKGDRKQIDQLFSNLLDNALKYLDPNRSGVIKISGYREKKKSIYCIEDNGIGIAQEHQKKIFEIFHQLNPETSSGEGLGLNKANRIIEKHLGKIWVESEYGKGSKFYVAIPMK